MVEPYKHWILETMVIYWRWVVLVTIYVWLVFYDHDLVFKYYHALSWIIVVLILQSFIPNIFTELQNICTCSTFKTLLYYHRYLIYIKERISYAKNVTKTHIESLITHYNPFYHPLTLLYLRLYSCHLFSSIIRNCNN
jgi:hypothetical protein